MDGTTGNRGDSEKINIAKSYEGTFRRAMITDVLIRKEELQSLSATGPMREQEGQTETASNVPKDISRW